jgi:hypothetical protein
VFPMPGSDYVSNIEMTLGSRTKAIIICGLEFVSKPVTSGVKALLQRSAETAPQSPQGSGLFWRCTPARLPFSIGLGGARNVGMSVSSIVASDRARVEHIRADARARQPLSSAASDPVAPSHGGKSVSRSVHSINATNSIVRALESAYTRQIDVWSGS